MVYKSKSSTAAQGKVLSASKIEKLISGVVTDTDASTLSAMAKIIKEMGFTSPEMSQLPAVSENSLPAIKVPKLTKTESLMLSLMAAPEMWHLAARLETRRPNIGLGGFGSCFEIATRTENGMVNHYVRYTAAGSFSARGQLQYSSLRVKLLKIQEAAKSGRATIVSNKATGSMVSNKSLAHASKYQINEVELKFLEVACRPDTRILVAENHKKASLWQTFRWKWQQYGFDLSQLFIEQEKQPDGTFNIYVTCKGIPNEGISRLVNFLSTKPSGKN